VNESAVVAGGYLCEGVVSLSEVGDELMPSALDGSLPLDELLSDYLVRDLRTLGPENPVRGHCRLPGGWDRLFAMRMGPAAAPIIGPCGDVG
jgi:hypothetical protein